MFFGLRVSTSGSEFENSTIANVLSPGDNGKLQWMGNWVTFLDTMLQMIVVGLSGRSLRVPTRIRSVCIDPAIQLEKVGEYADGKLGTCSTNTWKMLWTDVFSI